MGKGYGDRLASGGMSASFAPVGNKMSQKEWDQMFAEKPQKASKKKLKKK